MEPAERLDGWKEIAAYMNRSVKTVQRWEADLGLPVHRVGGVGGPGGSVFALREEIDAWMVRDSGADASAASEETDGEEGSARRRGWIGAVALLLVAAIGAAYVLWGAYGAPSHPAVAITRDGTVVVAIDAEGHELWRWVEQRRFEATIGSQTRPAARVLDVDGDGRNEVLVGFKESSGGLGRVVLFDASGQPLWEHLPGREVTLNGTEYRHDYPLEDVLVLDVRGEPWLAIVSVHRPWFPTWVEWLRPATGEVLGSYLHTGYLFSLYATDLDGDGAEELLAGGYNNYLQSAVMAVIRPSASEAVSPGPTDWSTPARPGQEYAYLCFAPSRVAAELGFASWVREVRPHGDLIQVETRLEDVITRQERIHFLNRRLELESVDFPTTLGPWLEELRREGRIDHGLQEEARVERILQRVVDGSSGAPTVDPGECGPR